MALEEVGLKAVIEGLGKFQSDAKKMEDASRDLGRQMDETAKKSGTMGQSLDKVGKDGTTAGKGLKDAGTGAGEAAKGMEHVHEASNKAKSGMHGMHGQATGLKGELQQLGMMAKMAGEMMLVMAAIAIPTAIGGAALTAAADYQDAMNMLQAVTGATGEQMAALGKKAKELGADMSLPTTSAGDAGQAMLELGKAGLSVDQILTAAPGTLQLAAAGALDVAEAAKITANGLNAFGLAGTEATRIADLFAGAANASSADVKDLALGFQMASQAFAMVGWTADDLTVALAEMANKGIAGSDAGTSLKTMAMSLINPTKEAAAMMKELGISVYDTDGKMRPIQEVIKQFYSALEVGAETTTTTTVKTAEMGKEFKNSEKDVKAAEKAIAEYSAKIGPLTASMDLQARTLQRNTLDYNALVKNYGASSKQAQNAAIAIDRLKLSMSNNQNTLAGYNQKIAENQAKLGQATGNLGKYQKAGEQTVTTTQKMTEEERNKAYAVVFGSDAIRSSFVVLNGGIEKHEELRAVITREGAAAELAAARTKGLRGAWEGLGSQIETVLLEAMEPFMGGLEDMVRGIADSVIPAFDTMKGAVQGTFQWYMDNQEAMNAAFVAMGATILYLTLVTWGWAAAAWGAAAGVIAATWPVVAVIAAVGAAAFLLMTAWQNDWGGIRTQTLAVWAILEPIFNQVKDWLGVQLANAVKTLSDYWTGTLQPALEQVWSYINTNIIPLLSELANEYLANVQLGLGMLATVWEETLSPALNAMWDFINDYIFPLLDAFLRLFLAEIAIAFRVIALTWDKQLYPALSAMWGFIERTLGPVLAWFGGVLLATVNRIMGDIATAWNTALGPALNALWQLIQATLGPILDTFINETLKNLERGFNFVKDAIQWVIDGINALIDAMNRLAGTHPPDFLEGHSPPPFANWLGDVAGQMERIALFSAPLMQRALNFNMPSFGLSYGQRNLSIPATIVDAGGRRSSYLEQNYNYNYNPTIHTNGSVADSLSYAHLLAWSRR